MNLFEFSFLSALFWYFFILYSKNILHFHYTVFSQQFNPLSVRIDFWTSKIFHLSNQTQNNIKSSIISPVSDKVKSLHIHSKAPGVLSLLSGYTALEVSDYRLYKTDRWSFPVSRGWIFKIKVQKKNPQTVLQHGLGIRSFVQMDL